MADCVVSLVSSSWFRGYTARIRRVCTLTACQPQQATWGLGTAASGAAELASCRRRWPSAPRVLLLVRPRSIADEPGPHTHAAGRAKCALSPEKDPSSTFRQADSSTMRQLAMSQLMSWTSRADGRVDTAFASDDQTVARDYAAIRVSKGPNRSVPGCYLGA